MAMTSLLPPAWFASWALANGDADISVPRASFYQLTAAEAAATVTGDIRCVLFSLNEALWVKWSAVAVADRPAKWVMSKSASVNTATGEVTYQYVHTFKVDILTQEVDAET